MALKEEAAERKFPDNELLQRLIVVMDDVQRCQSRSTELLNSKQSSKMSLQELRALVDTMLNLPCVMEQLAEVQVCSRSPPPPPKPVL